MQQKDRWLKIQLLIIRLLLVGIITYLANPGYYQFGFSEKAYSWWLIIVIIGFCLTVLELVYYVVVQPFLKWLDKKL